MNNEILPSPLPKPKKYCVGVLCGGGPAPGFNSVIASVVIRADQLGYMCYGFYDGLKYLMDGKSLVKGKHYLELKAKKVSRIMFKGGSIIRSARANPKNVNEKDPDEGFRNCVKALGSLNVKYLVTIGGDDTCSSANRLFVSSKEHLKCVHIPKTIDNDLPLPGGMPTFGYQTAVELGSKIVYNLMTDAETAFRFFLITCMGRKSGFLSLGIGKASSAHLTLIPEEFIKKGEKYIDFERVLDVLEGCVVKRIALGRPHGVILLAEGLLEFCDPKEVAQMFPKEKIKYDSHGHIRLELLDIEGEFKKRISERLEKRKLKVRFTTKKLGYELRCNSPIATDRIYTRDLGWSAVTYLLNKDTKGGVLMTMLNQKANPIKFKDLKKTKDGSTEIRVVDIKSESFEIARTYMIRISQLDFEDKYVIQKFAKAGGFANVKEFEKHFAELKKHESSLRVTLKKSKSTIFD